jgi:hypothetical protein
MASALAAGALAMTASPAAASPGPCHPFDDGYGRTIIPTNGFGGWCDGTGPSSYRAKVICRQGAFEYRAVGAWRWYGDRRGSWVSCGRGYYVSSQGFE